MEVNSSIDLSHLLDPINFGPLTDVIDCPHKPSHHYESGTLPKKTENGIEFYQCSLTNQWFPSSEFIKNQFASDASNKAHEIYRLYLEEKEKNTNLTTKNDLLTKETLNLTQIIKNLEKNIQELREKEDFNKKNIEELKKSIQKINEDREEVSILSKLKNPPTQAQDFIIIFTLIGGIKSANWVYNNFSAKIKGFL